MCLIAFAIGLRPHSPLLVAANRDEFWHRPTRPLARWSLDGERWLVAGQDLQAGGTWMGFAEGGRVAMLTNVRHGPPEAAPRSRGELLTLWLTGQVNRAQDLAEQVDPGAYGGFNLVLGDVQQGRWAWLSNRAHDAPAAHAAPALHLPAGWQGQTLGPGLYGLSNASLNTPWSKSLRLTGALAQALDRLDASPADDGWRQPLLGALTDRQPASEADLPATGLPQAHEQALSAPFVHIPATAYGTRSSLLARWHGPSAGAQLDLEEWTHDPHRDLAPGGTWSLAHSRYQRISMATWGMPTSS